VYYIGSRNNDEEMLRSDQTDQSDQNELITSFSPNNQGSTQVIKLINENPKKFSTGQKTVDQLISCAISNIEPTGNDSSNPCTPLPILRNEGQSDLIKGETPDQITDQMASRITSVVQEVEISDRANPSLHDRECPRTGLPLPQPFEIKVDGLLGTSTATFTALKIRKDNKVEIKVEYEFANKTKKGKRYAIGKGKEEIEILARKEIANWQAQALCNPDWRYRVRELSGTVQDPEYLWVENCLMIASPNHPIESFYRFTTPDMRVIQVCGEEEFEFTGIYSEILKKHSMNS
jgi:hypothetical protein